MLAYAGIIPIQPQLWCQFFKKTFSLNVRWKLSNCWKFPQKQSEYYFPENISHYKDHQFRKWSLFLTIIVRIYTLLLFLWDIFLFPVQGCCAVTDYLLKSYWKQIIFTAQQSRTGNRKICPEVMKDKIYCQVRNTFLSELPVKNERKLYAPNLVVITIICPEVPGI